LSKPSRTSATKVPSADDAHRNVEVGNSQARHRVVRLTPDSSAERTTAAAS
jgi:hypothetical protein